MPSVTDRDRAETNLGIPPPLNVVPQNALTALVGGAQAGTAMGSSVTRFTTVASAGDSGQLPFALPGRTCVGINDAAANSMNVFPQTGESIDAGAANAAVAIAAGKRRHFYCAVAGLWSSLLGA